MYNSTLSLTSPLDGVGGKRHALAALPRKRDPVATVLEAGWVPGMVYMSSKDITHRDSITGPFTPS